MLQPFILSFLKTYVSALFTIFNENFCFNPFSLRYDDGRILAYQGRTPDRFYYVLAGRGTLFFFFIKTKKNNNTVISRQATPVYASICSLDVLAFTGGACSRDYGTVMCFSVDMLHKYDLSTGNVTKSMNMLVKGMTTDVRDVTVYF